MHSRFFLICVLDKKRSKPWNVSEVDSMNELSRNCFINDKLAVAMAWTSLLLYHSSAMDSRVFRSMMNTSTFSEKDTFVRGGASFLLMNWNLLAKKDDAVEPVDDSLSNDDLRTRAAKRRWGIDMLIDWWWWFIWKRNGRIHWLFYLRIYYGSVFLPLAKDSQVWEWHDCQEARQVLSCWALQNVPSKSQKYFISHFLTRKSRPKLNSETVAVRTIWGSRTHNP